ncbi:MAG: chromate efflux transporter [Caulobacter sp.]|nr:chromate efflux transporter [Caulobacter sp.]
MTPNSPREVFQVFLKLGLTSFGGPIAHLGYFRDELVLKRRWLDEAEYADLVALCQFLPGPASSQVGFALGLGRAGWRGALAAWTGFTLPSALVLLAFAHGASLLSGGYGEAVTHGLKLVAVAIVAQAVVGMARALTPDFRRASIAVVALLFVVIVGGAIGQIGAIVLGGALGLVFCRNLASSVAGRLPFGVSRRLGMTCLVTFALLLLTLPLASLSTDNGNLALADTFYRAGALVFGGGHVVLPLLQAGVVQTGWATNDAFLAGYGAAQAVPGPLFTFAAYLGAVIRPEGFGVVGAALALFAVFVPGFLLLVGVIPFWDTFRTTPAAQAAMKGTNAAVVGILTAALYNPIWTNAISKPADILISLAGLAALTYGRIAPAIVVTCIVLASVLIQAF